MSVARIDWRKYFPSPSVIFGRLEKGSPCGKVSFEQFLNFNYSSIREETLSPSPESFLDDASQLRSLSGCGLGKHSTKWVKRSVKWKRGKKPKQTFHAICINSKENSTRTSKVGWKKKIENSYFPPFSFTLKHFLVSLYFCR